MASSGFGGPCLPPSTLDPVLWHNIMTSATPCSIASGDGARVRTGTPIASSVPIRLIAFKSPRCWRGVR